DGPSLVDLADFGECAFAEFFLPLARGGVAVVDSASEGADGVDVAETFELKGAAAAGAGIGDVGGGEGSRQAGEGIGGFEPGGVEAVAVLFESAAAAAGGADGGAALDLGGDEGVDALEFGG